MTKKVTRFVIATHTQSGEPMVEVWRDDVFVAGIYAHEEGVQLVSKYFDGVEHKPDYPPGLVLKLTNELTTENPKP